MAKFQMHKFAAYNYKGVKEEREVDGRLLAQIDLVALIYDGCGSFTVVYGLEVSRSLDRTRAAQKFGEAILHQAQGDGLIK